MVWFCVPFGANYLAWLGEGRHGVTGLGLARSGQVRFGKVLCPILGLVMWLGKVWLDVAWYGLAWLGKVRQGFMSTRANYMAWID